MNSNRARLGWSLVAWVCSSIGCGDSGPTPGVPTADSGTGVIPVAVDAGDASMAAPGSARDDGAVGNVDDEGIPTPDSAATDGPSVTPPDSSTIAGDAGPCPGLFCENFEQGQVDATQWVPYTINGATLEVQKNIAAHGVYAAHFRGLGIGNSYAYLVTKNAPAALQPHNFGRAYFYLAQQNRGTPDTGLIWGGTTGFPKPTYLSLAEHSGGWQLGFIKLQGSPGGESQAYPPPPIPVAKWICLEWEFSDQPTGINLWADGAVVGSLDANDVAYPPNNPKGSLFNGKTSGLVGAFTDFGFGFYDWHPDMKAYDYYYDDIVLDTKRVGCL